MIPVFLLSAALLALAVWTVVEVLRLRAGDRARLKIRHRHPRRQPYLEDQIRTAFDAPREQFGEIFVSYMIWRRERETRLELFAGAPWHKLNEFTRSLIVRHLWRVLETLVEGSVVIVDAPAQQWTKEIDATFDDRGFDLWGPPSSFDGPQFARD